MSVDFGRYIRHIREQRGLSRPEVVYRLRRDYGVSISDDTLVAWEKGATAEPGAGTLATLVELYEADYEQVFSRLVRRDLDAAAGPPVPIDPPPTDTPPRQSPRGRRRRGAQ